MRTLEEVLKDLKEAEKEYADKCLQYGIEEKKRRKKDDTQQAVTSENGSADSQEVVQEDIKTTGENKEQ